MNKEEIKEIGKENEELLKYKKCWEELYNYLIDKNDYFNDKVLKVMNDIWKKDNGIEVSNE